MPAPLGNEVLFETEGKLLVSRAAPLWVFATGVASFFFFLVLFRWIWAGYAAGTPSLTSSVLGACTVGFGGNVMVWRALRDYRVRVTEQALSLWPTGRFSRSFTLTVDRIKTFRPGFRLMHGEKAMVVEIVLSQRKEPVRLLVKDPEGLLLALQRICTEQMKGMARRLSVPA